jgi:membrane fusion protein, multidrug efflux system
MTRILRSAKYPHRSPKSPFLIYGALMASTLIFIGCSEKGGAKPGAPQGGAMPVSVATVEQRDVPLVSSWVGTMDGYVNAQIQPQVSGYMVKQTYTEGSQVAKGQVLFEIDPRPFQAVLDQALGQVAQAKGQLANAEAQLGLARINVKRDTPLAAQRAIAQSQLDTEVQQQAQGEAQVESAKAQIAAAEAAVETAKLNLGFTHVRSLIAGIAGQATVQVGNLVSPQSVLTSVSNVNPIKVFFSISDSEYLSLVEAAKAGGGDLLKGSAKIPLTLALSNGQKYSQQGRIVYVDRQMNQQTGAIRIAASFPNPGNMLRPGQFGRVSAPAQVRRGALLIPQIAVQEMQGVQQVYTVGADNKVHIVNVTLGPEIGNEWVVMSGVKNGEKVITDNLQKLREGSPVSPHAGPNEAPTSNVGGSNAGSSNPAAGGN